MRATEIARIINAEIVAGEEIAYNLDIETACGSDLMSDVIAFVKERVALLTGLTNPPVLRTADLMDIRLIIFVRGKKPSAEMIQMAREQGIVLMKTHNTMFTACGELYQAGIKGDSSCVDH